jgi:hypothetical protein
VSRERLATGLDEALEAAAALGFPDVLKPVSDHIAHKSDLGLVLVAISDADALRAGWEKLQERIRAAAPHGRVTGVLVQEMVAGGIEVFAGVSRDLDFGLVLAFGLGGVAVELLQDVALRVLPLRAGEAEAMVNEIRGAALLRGHRGAGPFDIPALIRCLESFAEYAWADRESLGEVDLNPIKVLPEDEGCCILDALIVPRT